MYGARKWLTGFHLNLESLGGGSGSIGDVPAAALPMIGAGLGFVFHIDDALGSEGEIPRRRVEAASPPPAEVSEDEATEGSERPLRRKQ